MAWRVWPHRPRLALGIEVPAPWGGVWSTQAYTEYQPFTLAYIPRAERTGGRLAVSDWLSGRWRWTVSAGADEWSSAGAHGAVGAALQFTSPADRIRARGGMDVWLGNGGFATSRLNMYARSSTDLKGLTFVASGGIETATSRTPLDLWWAGDTGHVREALLRAHPLLKDGRLRAERLSRTFVHASLEAQHWWRVGGPLRAAVAAFGDTGRAERTLTGARSDADVGIGVRVSVTGVPGLFHVDLARGLLDRASAISVTYKP